MTDIFDLEILKPSLIQQQSLFTALQAKSKAVDGSLTENDHSRLWQNLTFQTFYLRITKGDIFSTYIGN